jgi:hypothetical protein
VHLLRLLTIPPPVAFRVELKEMVDEQFGDDYKEG